MSPSSLPPVEAPVLVAAVDGLPARLRKKLDDAVAKFGDRPVTGDGDRWTVAVDESTTVTLVTLGGVVRSADAVTCTCLLAPNCLHRAAVLALAPVYAPGAGESLDDEVAVSSDPGASGVGGPPGDASSGTASSGGVSAEGAFLDGASDAGSAIVETMDEPLTTQQIAAVAHLWRAAVAVLAGGVSGSGTVARTALLRAAHDAQACKVYRPAAAARIVATLLQAARTNEAHYRLADLTDALRELLVVTHLLRLGTAAAGEAGLLGSARRAYQLQGSLRLHGLCTTAVLADTGHAGVVTYVVDRQGGLWMIADLAPGDARRAATAGNATVALGETALSHRALTRAGLVVSGATASATRQLGAGKSVRAVTAGGVAWHEEPLAALWAPPAAEQVHRAFESLALPVTDRAAGSDLLFLSVRVLGTDGDAVFATAADGTALTLRVASDHPALAYRENLRLLGGVAGLEMLLIGRPDPGRRGTVYPLAVAPAPGTAWSLPPSHDGHADLAFDRLHRSHLPVAATQLADQTGGGAAQPDAAGAGLPDGHASGEVESNGETGGSETAAAPNGAAAGREPVGVDTTGGDLTGGDTAGNDTAGGEPTGGGTAGGEADGVWQPAVADPALHLLRAQVERAVSGGRTMLTFSNGRGPSDASRLLRARLDTGAVLLDGLTTAAGNRPRDAFGRLSDDDGTAFAQAWVAAAVYSDAATRAFAEASWLPGDPRLEAASG